MRTAALVVFLFSAVALVLAGPARADDIGPPPAACPFGTVAEADHSGPHCERVAACTPAACPAAMTCAERSFCVREVDCGGLRPAEDRCLREHVVGTCDEGRSCPEGARCVAHPTCVFAAAAAPATGTRSPGAAAEPASVTAPAQATGASPEPAGGCSAGTRAPSFALALPALLLLLVASRRR